MKDNIVKQEKSSGCKCNEHAPNTFGVDRASRIARVSAHFMKKNQTAYHELSSK